jgi:hypothetical protein
MNGIQANSSSPRNARFRSIWRMPAQAITVHAPPGVARPPPYRR